MMRVVAESFGCWHRADASQGLAVKLLGDQSARNAWVIVCGSLKERELENRAWSDKAELSTRLRGCDAEKSK